MPLFAQQASGVVLGMQTSQGKGQGERKKSIVRMYYRLVQGIAIGISIITNMRINKALS